MSSGQRHPPLSHSVVEDATTAVKRTVTRTKKVDLATEAIVLNVVGGIMNMCIIETRETNVKRETRQLK